MYARQIAVSNIVWGGKGTYMRSKNINELGLLSRRMFAGTFLGAAVASGNLVTALSSTLITRFNIILPRDPAFDSLQVKYFPTISSVSNYAAAIRPCLVLVANNTDLTAKGYAIRWSIQGTNGIVRNLDTYFIQRHKMLRTESRVLHPGDVRLLSPLFNFAPHEIVPDIISSLAGMDTVIEAALDGVVFENGNFIGKNVSMIKQRYVTTRHSEHDTALGVQRLYESNSPEEDVLSALNEHVHRGSNIVEPLDSSSLYLVARGLEAQRLLAVHRVAGSQGLRAVTAVSVRYPMEPATLLR